eukprot:CAMPEP_0197409040 /NCGR_PEP_ID=MMETSP1165-20131217/29300_1 /TAXON_ID=284809 /ORGANISM="Chrysocystis fragilis, Strain CCMP3189" /LENGTH=168 /DNA_ID=CAMNT_0042935483 /DNA_START=110 /DNA_END=617 /DNA_ORIENTATION=+
MRCLDEGEQGVEETVSGGDGGRGPGVRVVVGREAERVGVEEGAAAEEGVVDARLRMVGENEEEVGEVEAGVGSEEGLEGPVDLGLSGAALSEIRQRRGESASVDELALVREMVDDSAEIVLIKPVAVDRDGVGEIGDVVSEIGGYEYDVRRPLSGHGAILEFPELLAF